MSTYVQLINNLDQLKLTKIKEYIPNYLDNNIKNNLSIVDILKELTDKEIEFREERAAQINLTISKGLSLAVMTLELAGLVVVTAGLSVFSPLSVPV